MWSNRKWLHVCATLVFSDMHAVCSKHSAVKGIVFFLVSHIFSV